jgi:putative flippase GtrA
MLNLKDRSKEDWQALLTQFIKFGLVGLSNAIVLYGVYYLLLKAGMHYILAYIIAFILSVLNAYLWNNRFVFKNSTESFFKKIIKVYASYTFTFLLSTVLLYVWVDLLHVSDKIGPIINIVITTPINFIMNKIWAFRKKS